MNRHWSDGIDMLSPREQRAHWIAYMKLRWGIHRIGLAVNRKHCPILSQHKVLRDMIDDGTVVRVRQRRYQGQSNVTILYLPEHLNGLS